MLEIQEKFSFYQSNLRKYNIGYTSARSIIHEVTNEQTMEKRIGVEG